MKPALKKAVFALTAMGLALAIVAGAGEVVLRLVEPPPLLDQGKVVRASANPAKQYELLPGARGEIAGAPVSIDSFGCRDREYPIEKPEGVVRIVGIGDSLTFGQGVAEDATYLARLESDLGSRGLPVEVINCGVFGYNVDEEAARFAELVDLLHPDVAIIGYELGDILRNPPPRREALAPGPEGRAEAEGTGAGDGGGAAAAGAGPRAPADGRGGGRRRVTALLKRSRVATFLAYRFSFLMKRFALRDWDGLYSDTSPLWTNLVEKYGAMSELARTQRVDVVVAIVPELSNLDARYPFSGVHARVAGMCRSHGMRVVDLLPTFLGQNGPSLWVHPQDRHPNARGHALIAEGLIDELEARVASRLAEGGTAVVSAPAPETLTKRTPGSAVLRATAPRRTRLEPAESGRETATRERSTLVARAEPSPGRALSGRHRGAAR